MTDRFVSTTPGQILAREDAAMADPSFETLEGRALQDVRETLAYLSMGMEPRTVLYGLLANNYGPFDSVLANDEDGRDAIQIGVMGRVENPVGLNERGDKVQDILEGLVALGLVERAFEPGSVDAALLPEDSPLKNMDRPTYRLSTSNLPEAITQKIEQTKSAIAEHDEYVEERESRRQRKGSRTGLFSRRRNR